MSCTCSAWMSHCNISRRYQELVGEDAQVEKWITDLTRRVAANQRTANVAE